MNWLRLLWFKAKQHLKMRFGLISRILRYLPSRRKIALKKSHRAVSAKNQRAEFKDLRLQLIRSLEISLSIRINRINKLFRFFLKVRSKTYHYLLKTSSSKNTHNSTKLESQAIKISLILIISRFKLSLVQRQIHLHFNNNKSRPAKCLIKLSSSL